VGALGIHFGEPVGQRRNPDDADDCRAPRSRRCRLRLFVECGLSIAMIRRLHERLGISADVLIRPSRKSAA